MWGIYITTLPIVSLLTALAVSVVWIRITRRYARLSNQRYREYETYLEEKTKAVQALFFQVHHQGPRAAMASVLGLLNLYAKESKTVSENLVLLSRPNHHRYGILTIRHKAMMDEYIEKIERICKELHEHTVKAVQKFEHLQE